MENFRNFLKVQINGKEENGKNNFNIYLQPLFFNNFIIDDDAKNIIKGYTEDLNNSFIDLEMFGHNGNTSSTKFVNIVTADGSDERYAMVVDALREMTHKALKPLQIDCSIKPNIGDVIIFNKGVGAGTICYDGETPLKYDYYYHAITKLTDDEISEKVDKRIKDEFLTQFVLYFDDKEIGYVIETKKFNCELPSKLKYLVKNVSDFYDVDIEARLFDKDVMRSVTSNITKKQIEDFKSIGVDWSFEISKMFYMELIKILFDNKLFKKEVSNGI